MAITHGEVTHNTDASADNVQAIKDRILVTDIEHGDRVSSGGIIILDDNATEAGIRPRWARVWKIGPEQKDVKVGQYIYIEHGRWSRGVKLASGETIRMVDNECILAVSDEKPGTYI